MYKKIFIILCGFSLIACSDPKMEQDARDYGDVLDKIEDINTRVENGEISDEDAQILYDEIETEVNPEKNGNTPDKSSSGR